VDQNSAKTYCGRFAPSPTGPLHLGSIVTAVGSYLQAKSKNGKWLVRIEDLDPPREVKGASDIILYSLDALGLYWDGPVFYQSKQIDAYLDALEKLKRQDVLFPCNCTRKTIEVALANSPVKIYPGSCRNNRFSEQLETLAIRVRVDHQVIEFTDTIQGSFKQQLNKDVGDFVIRRADGLIAYQLAVVIDDAQQNISEIIRGADLFDNTPRQIFLQQLLSLPSINYGHLPLVVDANGIKISKQAQAPAVDVAKPVACVHTALNFLGQNPPQELLNEPLNTLWQWAITNWNIKKVPQQQLKK